MSTTPSETAPGGTAPLPPLRYYSSRSRWDIFNLRELWRNRELAWILGLRDVKVRYKQTLIGVGWSALQPLSTFAVFAFVFGLLGKAPVMGETPYALTALAGIVAWQFFAGGLGEATRSMAMNRNLITKVYFPRVLLLISPRLLGLLDLLIGTTLLVITMIWYGFRPGWPIVFWPFMVLLAALATFGIGLWLSALNAIYRDVEHLVSFAIQTGFFISPVTYATATLIPPQWQAVYALNPAVCVLEGFRWTLLADQPFPAKIFLISLGVNCIIFATGAWYFQRTERYFADRV